MSSPPELKLLKLALSTVTEHESESLAAGSYYKAIAT